MTSRVCTCNRLNYLLVTTPESLILVFKPHTPPTHSCGRPAQLLLAFLDDRNFLLSVVGAPIPRASSILSYLSRVLHIFAPLVRHRWSCLYVDPCRTPGILRLRFLLRVLHIMCFASLSSSVESGLRIDRKSVV